MGLNTGNMLVSLLDTGKSTPLMFLIDDQENICHFVIVVYIDVLYKANPDFDSDL